MALTQIWGAGRRSLTAPKFSPTFARFFSMSAPENGKFGTPDFSNEVGEGVKTHAAKSKAKTGSSASSRRFVMNKRMSSIFFSAAARKFTPRRRINRIELSTHYMEVNYRTLKAVVFYKPDVHHIPHKINVKIPNFPTRSGKGCLSPAL